jgi:hypothetical protein
MTSPPRFSVEWNTSWASEDDLQSLDPDAITRFEQLKQARKMFPHTTMSEHEWSVARTYIPGANAHLEAQAVVLARLVDYMKKEIKELSVDGLEDADFVFAAENGKDELRAQELLHKLRDMKVKDVPAACACYAEGWQVDNRV